MEKNKRIFQELTKLALKYRKTFDDQALIEMAKATARALERVPVYMLEPLFIQVFEDYEFFPDDKKIIRTWLKIKPKELVSGNHFFDCWGAQILVGTFYTWVTRPLCEWLVSGEIQQLINFKNGKMSQSQEMYFKNKKFDPFKGQIQKPRHEWDRSDFQFQDRFNADYESLRARYVPLLGLEFKAVAVL